MFRMDVYSISQTRITLDPSGDGLIIKISRFGSSYAVVQILRFGLVL